MKRHVRLAAAAAVAVAPTCPQSGLAKQDKNNDFGVETISTRADYVTGGDVLVKITYKHDNRNHPLSITLNGRTSSPRSAPAMSRTRSWDLSQVS